MEVVNHHEGLQVDEGRYPSPQQHYPSANPPYPYPERTPESGLIPSTYHGTPSPKPEYQSVHQVVPPQKVPQRRPAWLIPALLGGLIAAFIVGGAVGGGLGATLSQCRSQLSSESTTPSPTEAVPAVPSSCSNTSAPTISNGLLLDYEPPAATEIYNVKVDCAKLNSSLQISQLKDKYVVQCSMDYPGATYSDGDNKFCLADIAALRAYSFQDCIDACSSTSRTSFSLRMGVKCKSVTFGRTMKGQNSNCWLKNGTLIDGQGISDDQFVSARLK
ncbi:uncharacterized protein B0I36DRAFT_366427 [Microdochium trichocladiopsis]|uniref:Apple domain-containing protein n=1 Tax=Microdochium trichocladiopsis TaxID=1682393 RepID=A0A9P8XX85_9PEZI|nr:uncharacterized protein B0I36DRAFT_366427 [Microdochium trichocladiopsis]KAH7024482.1 hypothetical protein B0I36DRAFT_366427 [Microdochium trichocladiopsis]